MNVFPVEFNSVPRHMQVSQHKAKCLSANKQMNKQTYGFNTITRQTDKNKHNNNNNSN